MKILMKKLCGY
ncbi:hypothetical protein ID866_11355 [Astraeus odoratus]|nr:hypothetical protein ID866_11355 [Astraeus odoratus]